MDRAPLENWQCLPHNTVISLLGIQQKRVHFYTTGIDKNVYSSIIHLSPKLEPTQCLSVEWIKNCIFVLWVYYTAMRMNELYTSHGEATTYDFHNVKQKKSDTIKSMRYGSIYIMFQSQAILTVKDGRQKSVCLWWG